MSRKTVVAPGVCNRSTHPGNSYALSTGTSIASPLVAGTAALYKARHSDATTRQGHRADPRPGQRGARKPRLRGDPRSPLGNRYYGYLAYAGDS